MNSLRNLNKHIQISFCLFRLKDKLRILKLRVFFSLLFFFVSLALQAYTPIFFSVNSYSRLDRIDSLSSDKGLLITTDSMLVVTDSLVQMMDSLTKIAKRPVVEDSTLLHCYAIDWQSGDSIPYVNAAYRHKKLGVSADANGYFTIERRNGEQLTITAIGYKPRYIKIT